MMLFCGGCLQSPAIPRNFAYFSAIFVTFMCCIQISLGFNFIFDNRRNLVVAIASIGRTAGAIAAAIKVQEVEIPKNKQIN